MSKTKSLITLIPRQLGRNRQMFLNGGALRDEIAHPTRQFSGGIAVAVAVEVVDGRCPATATTKSTTTTFRGYRGISASLPRLTVGPRSGVIGGQKTRLARHPCRGFET
jgi:hypothetical protein